MTHSVYCLLNKYKIIDLLCAVQRYMMRGKQNTRNRGKCVINKIKNYKRLFSPDHLNKTY